MNVLLLGASGYVGRAVIRRFRQAGHAVTGLARSDAAAAIVAEAGAVPLRGDLDDLSGFLGELGRFDAVIVAAVVGFATERRCIDALVDALAGSGKCLIVTSGTGILSRPTGGDWHPDCFAEDDVFEGPAHYQPRVDTELAGRAGASRGVRSIVIRPPLIWGHGRCPPVAALHASARTGAIAYIGRGLATYGTVHVDDLADIYLLAAERGVAGALYHAVSGETNWRAMAEAIARLRGLPVRSIAPSDAAAMFGPFLGPTVFSSCSRTSCPRTRAELGWTPHPDRLDLFAELAHPAFMAIDGGDAGQGNFTLAEAYRKGRAKD